jgi:hypothetical protein
MSPTPPLKRLKATQIRPLAWVPIPSGPGSGSAWVRGPASNVGASRGAPPIWYFPTRTPTRGMGTHAAQNTLGSVSEGIASKGTSMLVVSSTRSGLTITGEFRFVLSRKARSSMTPAPSS